MRTLVSCAVAAAAAAIALGSAVAQPVNTDAGLIQGVPENDITVFKGVPFAAPPVGALRWRPPEAVKPWDGVKKTDAYKPRCMQVGPNYPFGPDEPMSEDCLYLNLWRPAAAPASAKLPVMVWIYGGGFQNGSASDPLYFGANLARRGVVFVGINYRVGMLGFLSHPELTAESPHHASGDYGLMDMIAALQWVKRNVAAFGGDPQNVTIFGQSAGSDAVSLLVGSPLAKGLFQRAIGESGGEFAPPEIPRTMDRLTGAEAFGVQAAAKLGAKSLADLRALPADMVTAAGPMWPVIDGYVVPEPLYATFATGRQTDVSTLVGSTADEGANLLGRPQSAADYGAATRKRYGPYADKVLALFPGGSDKQAAMSQRLLMRDNGFGWPMWTWARLQSKTGKAKVFQYYFDRRPPLPDQPQLKDWGAEHGADLLYVFGNPPPTFGWTDDDRRYGEMMSGYWTNFARTGDPNGPGLPKWPAFSNAHQKVMHFDAKPAPENLPNRRALELLDRYVADVRAGTFRPQ